MVTVGVDCTFTAAGNVQVRQVQIGEQWQRVGQGRQWLDQHGRHVLIMLPGSRVREIVLRPDTMAWELIRDRGEVRAV
jgi:hypothetical protein